MLREYSANLRKDARHIASNLGHVLTRWERDQGDSLTRTSRWIAKCKNCGATVVIDTAPPHMVAMLHTQANVWPAIGGDAVEGACPAVPVEEVPSFHALASRKQKKRLRYIMHLAKRREGEGSGTET